MLQNGAIDANDVLFDGANLAPPCEGSFQSGTRFHRTQAGTLADGYLTPCSSVSSCTCDYQRPPHTAPITRRARR
jgi:hypothetical protein